MSALPKNHKHGRIKEKYNPKPNAKEKVHHIRMIGNDFCVCGCGQIADVVHHILQEHPQKRWRRDHQLVAPMFHKCHMHLHDVFGDEIAWQAQHGVDLAQEVINQWNISIYRGAL
jgi:hypothetical protein